MTDLAEQRDVETRVYQPAEDSMLLAETVAPELSGNEMVLEVGCGSGVVANYLDREVGVDIVASDVNPHACRATAATGLQVVRCDLVAGFTDQQFDAVLFNPPYLPADVTAHRDDWMEVALTGGPDGQAVITRFLTAVSRVLRPGGSVFLIVSSLTGVESIIDIASDAGFSAVALADTSYPYETLTVLKLIADPTATAST